ncbi:MAG: glycosyltransferase family 4 protein [Pyrobaculum sp.]
MKVKVLLIWGAGLPHRYHPSFTRPYYLIKHYSTAAQITLVSPYIGKIEFSDDVDVKLVDLPQFRSRLSKVLYTIAGRLSLENFRYSRDFNFARLYYPDFQREVSRILRIQDYDVVYADFISAPYLLHYIKSREHRPVVLEFFSPELYAFRNFASSGYITYLLRYILLKLFELRRYRLFDGGVYVSQTHLELSKPYTPKRCFVIPPGVDTEYFQPFEKEEDSDPTILFMGTMSYPPNVSAVLWFYRRVYPLVKKEVPRVKFFIVGRAPDRKILRLSSDKSVVVTGEVEDVRVYLAKASVFVNPIILDDGGIKTKVLEAMASAKAIVSTPLGVRDLGVENEKHVMIAANEKDFADKIINLLRDEGERHRLGREARKFAEENYSWEKISRKLYDVLNTFAISSTH